MNQKISLIGAPTDIGAGSRGASMGPEALRVANIGPVLESHGLEVIDRVPVSDPGGSRAHDLQIHVQCMSLSNVFVL